MRKASSERVAVLSNEGLYVEGQTDEESTRVPVSSSLSRVLHVCRDRGISQLWIHSSFQVADFYYQGARQNGWTLPEQMRPWVKTWQGGTYGAVSLAIPALEHRTAWRQATTGAELLAAIVAFRCAVGIPYRSSPGATGQQLMRESVGKLDLSGSVAPRDMPPPTKATTERDLLWMRPLTAEEQGMRYIHAFDKNAMYVAAARGLKLGFGVPKHITGGAGEFLRRGPGYWNARPVGWPSPFLPPMLGTGEKEWVHTERLAPAIEGGYITQIEDAWTWPDWHEALTPWAKRITAALAEMRPKSLERQVLKTVYAHAIGWLDYRGARDSDQLQDLYRPDWFHAIKAKARANMWRNAAAGYKNSGRAPFAAAVDCLYYVTDDDSAEWFAEKSLCLNMGSGVGQYKVKHDAVPVKSVRDCIEKGGTRGLTAMRMRLGETGEEAADEEHDS